MSDKKRKYYIASSGKAKGLNATIVLDFIEESETDFMQELKTKLEELGVNNIQEAMDKAAFHMLIGQPVIVIDKIFKIKK